MRKLAIVLGMMIWPVGATLNAAFTVSGLDPVIEPASGTTFDTALTINISCAVEGATIHFTTNGTTPTAESPVYKRFKISDKTTVKAIAVFADGSVSGVTTAEYAKGTLATPVITPADGTVFQFSDQEVSIAREGTDGTLRYTLDGSEPTAASAAYAEPFTISATTTVKAKIFGVDYLDSPIATAVLTREWLTVATPVIAAPTSFSGTKATATITCATDGATIRYTTDGSEPDAQSTIYTDAIPLTASCTIKARAFKADYLDSAMATVTATRVWAIGDALNDPDRTFTTDAEHGWTCDEIVNHDGEASMRSGELADSGKYGEYVASTMSTTVSGPGTVRFWWKASCEDDPAWDHGEFLVDGEVVTNIFGETEWRQFSYYFDTDGEHTLNWKYMKDEFDYEGSDCIWVDEFHWTPAYTTTTEVPVPGAWIDQYYPNTFDYEAAAKRLAANGVNSVEDAYVAGLDPTNSASVFTASVTFSNGMVYVSWTPYLNTGDLTRIYTISGRTDLVSGDWEILQPWHRFFKTVVSMPTGAAGEISDVSGEGFVPAENLGGVQLWKNGPYWAECNVGATKPEEYGYYFWWGDTVGYKRSGGSWTDWGNYYGVNHGAYSGVTWVSSTDTSMSNSPFAESICPTCDKSNSELQTLGYIDLTGNLTETHDAATEHLGSPWRMPTDAEFAALISNCTTTWITTNGVSGRLVTGKGTYASKSIFLPAAGGGSGDDLNDPGADGYYWSSTPDSGNSYSALGLHFDPGYFNQGDNVRYFGRSVRALREFAK